MNKYLMLQPKDVFDITAALENAKDTEQMYISPFIDMSELNERAIRYNMFEFRDIYFASYDRNEIVNLVCFGLPLNPPLKKASLEFKLVLDINKFDKCFFDFIKEQLNSSFPNISKITVLIAQNYSIKKVIDEFNFVKEITLSNELENSDVDIYSNFLKAI